MLFYDIHVRNKNKLRTKIAREVYTKQKLDEHNTEKEVKASNNILPATESELNGTYSCMTFDHYFYLLAQKYMKVVKLSLMIIDYI